MKKLLILAGLFALSLPMAASAATEETQAVQEALPPKFERPAPERMHRPPVAPKKIQFEKRLKLTDEQKAQAKLIHKKGFEKIKPIMDEIAQKRAEIEAVAKSKISTEAQKEKFETLRKDIRDLKRKAHEIRKENMQEFESILTKKQLKELNKMKEEGRKNFEKNHPGHSMLKPVHPTPYVPEPKAE